MGELLGQLPRPEGGRLAWRRIDGRGPTVVWLGGFRSDMSGTKAQALADWAVRSRRAFLRFDYSGHGESAGDFAEGTIGRWREDALAAVDKLVPGPLVLVGSSMGGWLACLLALARPERVQGLVLIAPALDFTEALMWPALSEEARRSLEQDGYWMQPSEYGPPYPLTQALFEDGRRWSLLPGPIRITAPVRILQGARDPDVPWTHAIKLVDALESADVAFTLVKDGDHRLSTPADLQRLEAAAEELAAMAERPSR